MLVFSISVSSLLQTMIVPMFEDLLHWSELEISLFFCGAGVEVSTIISNVYINLQNFFALKLIVSFILLRLLSKKISDRYFYMHTCSTNFTVYFSYQVAIVIWVVRRATGIYLVDNNGRGS